MGERPLSRPLSACSSTEASVYAGTPGLFLPGLAPELGEPRVPSVVQERRVRAVRLDGQQFRKLFPPEHPVGFFRGLAFVMAVDLLGALVIGAWIAM